MKKHVISLLVAALLVLTLTMGLAQDTAGQPTAEELSEQMQKLVERQSELWEKVQEDENPEGTQDQRDLIFSPDNIKSLGVLNAEEEALFNATYAKIQQAQAGFAELDALWDQNDTKKQEEYVKKSTAIWEEIDKMWEPIQPLSERIMRANSERHIRQLNVLTDDEITRYLAAGDEVTALYKQADAIYVALVEAEGDEATKLEDEAEALYQKASAINDGIQDIANKISTAEIDAYYANLKGLTDEEKLELRKLVEDISALGSQLGAMEETPE